MPQRPLSSMLEFAPPADVTPLITAWVVIVAVALAIVHIGFAIGIWQHAQGRKTAFGPPWLWVLATLFGGPMTALFYWLMHCSSLRSADAP